MKHSYTSTRDFSCKRRYYHQHIARDVERESTPAMEYGWLAHKGLEQRLAGGEPLPDNLAQFESFAAAIDGARARGLTVDVERRLACRSGSPSRPAPRPDRRPDGRGETGNWV